MAETTIFRGGTWGLKAGNVQGTSAMRERPVAREGSEGITNNTIRRRIAQMPNLLFAALLLLRFLPLGRPGDPVLPVVVFVVLVEVFYLFYSFLTRDDDRVRTTGDLISILYGMLFLWDLLTSRLNVIDKMLFPSPGSIMLLAIKEIPAFLQGLVSSLGILSVGYGAAVVSGISLGLIAGFRVRLRKVATPLTRVLGPVPPTVYIPYAIVLLPTFKLASMFTIFVGAFWPIFINTMNGVFSIEGRIIDSAKVLGLSERTMLLKVILPGSLPSIMTGATIGLAMSFILLTAAEMIGATSGLGWYIKYFSDFADYPRVIVGIIYAGIVVTCIMFAFDKLEKRLLKWRQ